MPSTVIDLIPNPVTLTILRSPVDRALSDYWYCYHETKSPAHAEARRLHPAAFCAAGFSQASNGQARYLSGSAFEGITLPEEELLQRALRVLERLDYIGTWENFRSTLEDVATFVGVSNLDASLRLNPAKRMLQTSCTDRMKIAAANRVDAALYTVATRGMVAAVSDIG
jgi:hypothetical protein